MGIDMARLAVDVFAGDADRTSVLESLDEPLIGRVTRDLVSFSFDSARVYQSGRRTAASKL